MSNVRAKFKVDRVILGEGIGAVELSPVTSDNEENKKFFKWTPAGAIRMDIVNLEALKVFEPGKQYYVDFTLAE